MPPPRPPPAWHHGRVTWTRALLAWLVLLAVGFANGTLRQLGYGRLLPDAAARQLSTAAAIVLLGAAVWLLTRAWPLRSAGQAWRVGAVWVVLTFLFETGLGVAEGQPWSEILGAYALWRGQLWALVPAFLLVAPRLALAGHSAASRA